MIAILVKKLGTKRWAEVATRMSERYGLQERTGKQCRERWHNHLDPSISKKPWSHEEEMTIFEKHKEFGNRWTEITKFLPGRTDNSVKNHFYSTLRKSLRRINKILGSTNSTIQMRTIRPSILSQVLSGFGEDSTEVSEACLSLQNYLLEFSRSKPSTDLLEPQRQHFEAIIQKIISLNDSHTRRPSKGRRRRGKGVRRVKAKREPEEEEEPLRQLEDEGNQSEPEENYSRIEELLEGMLLPKHEEYRPEAEDGECQAASHMMLQSPWFDLNQGSPVRIRPLEALHEISGRGPEMDKYVQELRQRINNS